MDLKEIKQIVDLMKRSGLSEFEIEEKDLKLRICRSQPAAAPAVPPAGNPVVVHAPPAVPVAEVPPPVPGVVIRSPMVGTFYVAASPDSPAFVRVGDTVNPDSVVCIIEAMKVMNEIKAEISGTIAEVCVNNGESVEYGQPLFRVK